jgi:hypothetical protein
VASGKRKIPISVRKRNGGFSELSAQGQIKNKRNQSTNLTNCAVTGEPDVINYLRCYFVDWTVSFYIIRVMLMIRGRGEEGIEQRVVIDLLRTKLSRRRKIWLLPHPLPPLPQKFVSLSQSSCVSPVELHNGRWGGRGWGRSQIIRRRESLVLYKSSKGERGEKVSGMEVAAEHLILSQRTLL